MVHSTFAKCQVPRLRGRGRKTHFYYASVGDDWGFVKPSSRRGGGEVGKGVARRHSRISRTGYGGLLLPLLRTHGAQEYRDGSPVAQS